MNYILNSVVWYFSGLKSQRGGRSLSAWSFFAERRMLSEGICHPKHFLYNRMYKPHFIKEGINAPLKFEKFQ